MLAGAQTNHGSSVHAQWFSQQNGGADDHDVTRISHAIEGGNYKRGNATKLEEFGCSDYCRLGVLAQALGSLPNHRPCTLVVSVPLK